MKARLINVTPEIVSECKESGDNPICIAVQKRLNSHTQIRIFNSRAFFRRPPQVVMEIDLPSACHSFLAEWNEKRTGEGFDFCLRIPIWALEE